MTTGQWNGVVRHLWGLLRPDALGTATDAELLGYFVRDRDEAAFEVLLRRHGPRVLGVCRQFLRDTHLVEDAFQATFMVFVRKAGSIRGRESVASWLHGVALRTALRARTGAHRAQAREQAAAARRANDLPQEILPGDVPPLIREEVHRLPEKYRVPVLLCYFDGKSERETAEELCCPAGTVRARLARARSLLRSRLARRGVAVPAALLTAAVPAALAQATCVAALNFLAGAGSTPAAALARGVLRSMSNFQWKVTLFVAAASSLLALAYGLAELSARPAEPAAVVQPGEKARVDRFGDPLPAGAVARLGTMHWNHPGALCVACSPDGRTVVSGGPDRTVRLWDSNTGKELHRLTGHKAPDPRVPHDFLPGEFNTNLEGVQAVAFSKDSKLLATGAADGTVRLWDVATGKETAKLAGHDGLVRSVAFSPDGKLLATRTVPYTSGNQQVGDGVLRLWDVKAAKEIHKLGGLKDSTGKYKYLAALAFTRDGDVLGVSDGGSVLLLDPKTQQGKGIIRGPKDCACLAFSPDGKTLAIGSKAAEALFLYDAANGKQLWKAEVDDVRPYGSVAFSPDGSQLAAGTDRLRVFDPGSGKELFNFGEDSYLYLDMSQIAFSADGKQLITPVPPIMGGMIRRWDVATRKRIPTDGEGQIHSDMEHGRLVSALVFSADGKALTSAGWECRVWDPETGKELRRFVPYRAAEDKVLWPRVPTHEVGGTCLTSDGRYWAYYHRYVKLGKGIAPDNYGKIKLQPEDFVAGIHIVDLKSGKDHAAFKIDLANYQPPVALGAEYLANLKASSPVQRLAIALDGKQLLALGGDPYGGGTVFDDKGAARGQLSRSQGTMPLPIAGFAPDMVAPVFAADGKAVVTVDSGGAIGAGGFSLVRVHDPAARREMQSWRVDGGRVLCVALSTDGKVLAAGCWDGKVRLWTVADGKLVATCAGHQSPVGAVAFSADGRSLVSGHQDGAVRLWEAATGKERGRFAGHELAVTAVAFSADGRRVASGSSDATILVWDTAAAK
jgi:RNA polymerase sigma factor (sigma-70 family)